MRKALTNISFRLLLAVAALAVSNAFIPTTLTAQGVTTSSMSGLIMDQTKEPLIGATVVAVHTPSGSRYGTVTNEEGIFTIPGMRVGGPYEVTVSYIGYSEYKKNDVFLGLGAAYQLNATLSEEAVELVGVVVVSDRADIFSGNRTGQETNVNEATINTLPTVSRALGDYARYNPLASIGENADGFTISLAGQNNRYNTVYIDGAVNNDVFGLAGSGTNGGQTGVQPVSIDAIEAFTIAVAPFDVRQSGFAGGSINAVTRSGTNQLEGSAYTFFRNNKFTRNKAFENEDGVKFPDIADYSASTYGFRLGGPIVKNKVFFFVNAELQRDETPEPFALANYRGNLGTNIGELTNFVKSKYGYDVGTATNNASYLNSDKILGKLDFNLNDNNKLSVRHSFVRAENLEARGSSSGFLGFENGSEFFISTTNSTAVELNTLINNKASNNLKLGLTLVRDDRDPFGDPFPVVTLQDGENGRIEFGSEPFSTANLLNQDVLTITNDFTLYKGKHNILLGANFEYFNAGNLFVRQNFGAYQYFNDFENGVLVRTGVDKFLSETASDQFDRSYSQVDNITGDDSKAIAVVKQVLAGLYVQDDIQANEKLKLTAGLRVDVPFWTEDQPENAAFNNETAKAIEDKGYDLQGARTGQFIKTQLLFSPRLGFNYDVNGDRSLQIRGGTGIFTSRIPLVWPGGAYNNFGFNIGGVRTFDKEVFNPDVNNQPPGPVDLANPRPSGQIDLFSENFKLPQVWKTNLAVDYKLPAGFVVTAEGLISKYFNSLIYQNLNLDPTSTQLSGSPDNRPIFGNQQLDRTYTGVYLASNTGKGYGWNASLTLSKSLSKGLQGQVGYSYGDSYTVFDGTSSQNNSQWRGYYNHLGRNLEAEPTRSVFAAGHRIFAAMSYEVEYLKIGKSTFSVFLNSQSGNPFTYVVGSVNRNFVNDGGFDFNEVIYVPQSASDINLKEVTVSGTTYSPEQQWTILNDFIESDPNLSKFRGAYAERNSTFAPMTTLLDFRFLQDFFVMAGGKRHTLQFSLDMFNLGNLLNKNWGKVYNTGFGTFSPITLSGNPRSNNNVPVYTVNAEILEGKDFKTIWNDNLDDSGIRSSRYQMQIGLRYIFK